MKLHQLTGQFMELQALSEGADEEFAIAVRDTLEGIEGEFQEKGKAVAVVALNFDSDIEAIDAEIARLQKRKSVIKNNQETLKNYLRENMEATGISKISCPLFTITLAKGREVVAVYNESEVPDDLMRVKTEIAPDKTAIAAKLKAGEEVPGAKLERGQSSIRIK